MLTSQFVPFIDFEGQCVQDADFLHTFFRFSLICIIFAAVDHLDAADIERVSEVLLFNSAGRLVATAPNERALDTSSLPHGIYLLRIQKEKDFITRKLLVE